MVALGCSASFLVSGCAETGSTSDPGSQNRALPNVREHPWTTCEEVAGWAEPQEEVEVLSRETIPDLDPGLEGKPALACSYAPLDTTSESPYGTHAANSLLVLAAPRGYFDHTLTGDDGTSKTVIDVAVAAMRITIDIACASAKSVGGSCELIRDDGDSGSDELVLARALSGPDGSGTLSLIMARAAGDSMDCSAIRVAGDVNQADLRERTPESFDEDLMMLRRLADDACGIR